MKTNAVRFLDSLSVHYELREYEVDPNDLAAESVASKIGMLRSKSSKRCWRGATGTGHASP
jgi:prolyl-tRNA editing enzyme YbaK/EbsC (Cys-tRNA(Pro) deacylase)